MMESFRARCPTIGRLLIMKFLSLFGCLGAPLPAARSKQETGFYEGTSLSRIVPLRAKDIALGVVGCLHREKLGAGKEVLVLVSRRNRDRPGLAARAY